jgi:hypothetical protein
LATAPTKDAEGVAKTISVRWMGARTQSTVALGLMAQEPTQETRWQAIVRKSKGLAKRSHSEE